MAPKMTLGDKLTVSKIPVTASLSPKENAPLWLSTVGSLLLTLPAEMPWWAKVIVIVVGMACGVATQYFTVAASNLLERRGSSVFVPGGAVLHHDAFQIYGHLAPPSMLWNGRPDLAGPLCNTALASTGKVWLVAAGRANHAGLGSWRGLVGNTRVWGTEANNPGTGATWPEEQIEAYIELHVALGEYFGWPAEMDCRHAEWTSRKIDPWGPWYDDTRWEIDGADKFRAAVAQGGMDMPLNANDLLAVGITMKKVLDDVGLTAGGELAVATTEQVRNQGQSTREMTLDIIDAVAKASGIDPAKIRAELNPKTRAVLDGVD